MIDFTNATIDITSNYGGSDQKRGIIYHNKKFMLKLSDRIETPGKNNLMDSYSNSVYSEYICCHILGICGYDAQNTLLGTIVMDTKKHKDMRVPVVACENFVPEGYSLIEFKNIQNAIQPNKPGKIPKISEIYEVLGTPNAYFSKEQGEKAIERFWETFIFDSYFGNFDRHGNNWGYLINDNNEIKLAPVYDCGSCLYPQVSDEAIPAIINYAEEIKKRIDVFPKAALLDKNGNKIEYKNFINSFQDKECTKALLKIYPTINIDKINNFINNIEEISDIRKQFYKTMLQARFDFILTPAYNNAIEKIQSMDIDEPTLPEPDEYDDINDDIVLPEISSENIYKNK